MDRKTQKIIKELAPRAAELQSEMEALAERLRELYEGMEERMYERSEAWQEGPKGQALQEDMDRLQELIDAAEDVGAGAERLSQACEGMA